MNGIPLCYKAANPSTLQGVGVSQHLAVANHSPGLASLGYKGSYGNYSLKDCGRYSLGSFNGDISTRCTN